MTPRHIQYFSRIWLLARLFFIPSTEETLSTAGSVSDKRHVRGRIVNAFYTCNNFFWRDGRCPVILDFLESCLRPPKAQFLWVIIFWFAEVTLSSISVVMWERDRHFGTLVELGHLIYNSIEWWRKITSLWCISLTLNNAYFSRRVHWRNPEFMVYRLSGSNVSPNTESMNTYLRTLLDEIPNKLTTTGIRFGLNGNNILSLVLREALGIFQKPLNPTMHEL